MLRWIFWLAVLGIAAAIAVVALAPPRDRSAGTIVGAARPADVVQASIDARGRAQQSIEARAGRDPGETRQVLFGDLHVHSTFSIDAFVYALPMFAGGEGAHPPADACDFARYCSAVDFFSLNDHAEGLTPARWDEIRETMRQCNAKAGDPANPDMVAFTGWEWTQVGATPETHYGHRNVIFPGLADDELPARPITALPAGITSRARAMGIVALLEKMGPLGLGEYADFLWLTRQIAELPDCERGVDTRELPPDCRESADTPAELFEKLAQWGGERLVIPHGMAWGVHAPAGSTMENLTRGGNHDPQTERLIEIMSGHGNSEEFRPSAQQVVGADGAPICPAPTRDFLPCCWRAGEIVQERCEDAGLGAEVCEQRVVEARALALDASTDPHLVLPDTSPEDWLDCDQCRDCFKPAMNLRPRETAQFGLTLAGDASTPGAAPLRWGFIASTDNHTARPGTGYKQYDRLWMTDARGFANELTETLLEPLTLGRQADSARAQASTRVPRSFSGLLDVERGASFMYPGGIVGVHADGRDRRSIWDALMRREVFGTSGPRILLWFELRNGPDGPVSMGGEVALAEAPRFEVRAAGSFVQQPGCPPESETGLPADRLDRLCRGECYHPGDERHPIAAIEVVRVRPRTSPDERPEDLIDDPWRRFECPADRAGCVATFEDPEFVASGRGAAYYARALQVETPAINADGVRAEFDDEGNVVRTTPCHGTFRTSADDDCLAPAAERAWSSPIFVDPLLR